MHPAFTCLQRRLPIHITLFTRRTCNLCDIARTELSRAWECRPFEYAEVDVMRDNKWRVYEFDVPVIHIARTIGQDAVEDGEGRVVKLMHKIRAKDVVQAVDGLSGNERG